MPNYRQKNKKNKNKNRQKNQQQNQTQQQDKSKNQNQQENQQTSQSRKETGKKDNQSQSRSQREQSNQPQPPKPLKSPTSTANLSPPLVTEGEANSTQLHASSQDARKVDSTAPTVAFVQCDNFNSNDSDAATAPTTSHQAIRAAVDREECNRVEDADADVYFSKLDNTEAAHSETVTSAGGVSGVIDSAMGNKESKPSIKGTKMATTAETVAASSDLRGMTRPDRSILGARELDTLQPMSKTQMAKVIVHRIAREASEEEDKQKKNGDIDKVEQVANTGDKLHRMVTEVPDGYNVDVIHEQQKQSTNIQTAVNGRQLAQQPADCADLARQSQQSKVIIHKIEKEEGEELAEKQLKAQPKVIVQNEGRSKVDAKKSQSSEGAKVIVHKIEREMGNREATASVVVQQAIPDQKPAITEAIAESTSTTGMCNQLNDEGKVIIHHIQQYTDSTSPLNYQVELPDADSPTSQLCRSKQSILNKHVVQIQELSDESSSEYNDNPPLISEAESETESAAGACALDYAQSIRTLSPDSDDNYEVACKLPATPSQEQQDLKQRRAQKRVALETHFLPQLLSPRYLDSIIEENSDMSDTRSDCSENPLMTTLSGDDLHDPSVAKVRKANEIFPRSNLDFSRRHAKKQLGALPKKPSPIREEPVAMVVAAKIIDATTPAQESCIRLSSEHTPESEAAEVIYLSSSASSSLSDLVELDAEAEGDDEREDSCRSMIDLDTDVREIITKPVSEEQVAITNILSDSRESTPVNQASTKLSENNEMQKSIAINNRSVEQITAATIGTNIDTNTANTAIINPIESRIFENLKSLQLLAEPSGEHTLSSGGGATTIAYNRAATTTSESETETEMSSETITERCEYLRSSDTGGSSSSLNSSIEVKYPPATTATSDSLNVDPAVLLKNIELEMNSVRDILNSHTVEPNTITTSCGNAVDTRSSELNFDHINSAQKASPSPPPIPPPPTSASASDFHSDFTGSQIQPQPLSTAPPPIPTRAIHESTYVQTHTTEQKSPQPTNSLCSTNPALTSLSLLARQESAESHCSDSTQHSQCTAINVGSHPHTDNELTPPLTATSPISDEQQQRQYNDWKNTDGEDNASHLTTNSDLKQSSDKKDASIKKLRLLCTETLASMPFGEEVLVELATVAQNIGELQGKPPTQTQEQNLVAQQKTDGTMPYPLPQLPHISELQLSITDEQPHTSAPSSTLQRTTPSSTTSTTTTHTVVIKQLGGPKDKERDLTTAKVRHSPSPPPVPAPPSHYIDAPWLGMPTSADPNMLVCLSPAQQQQLTSPSSQQPPVGVQKQTDQLLDAHRKFLERRGYHEFTEEQVKKINTELQQEEQQILKTAAYMKKLRKSLTPPPPPVPPPPVPSKSSETAAKAQSQVRTTSTTSSIGSSITSSQRVYDATSYRNANEQTTATFANGEEQHQQNQTNQSQPQRLLLLRQNNGEAADANAAVVSVAGSSSQQQASSLENNSRQSSAAAAAQGGAPAAERKQPATSVDSRQYSNANASEPTNIRAFDSHGGNNYANSSFPSASGKMQSVESELAKMFPSMGSSNIFDSNRKRFSNIESSTASPGDTYCVQLQSTLPKRYSNIETRSYEAKKRIENGQVVYDYSNSQHERQSDGDKSLDSASTPSLLHFPVKEPSEETLQYPFAGDGTSSRSGNSEIMSAIKLNTTENAKTTTQETKSETNEKANEINMTNFAYPGATTSTTNTSFASSSHFADHSVGGAADATKREDHIKNSQANGGSVGPSSSGGDGSGNAYEEFRQRAKATAGAFGAFSETPATAPPLGESNKHSAFNFQHDKLFKDFDALSQQLNMELEEGKAHRQQREKSASLYDLSRTQWNFKDHFDQLKKQRHEHMQELEREIERSARSRQLKGYANGGNKGANNPPATGRTYDIPIHIEQRNGNNSVHSNGYAQATSDRSSMPREQTQQRSYHIPIVMENGAAPKVPPSPTQYDTVDDASRFRRAESMFNLSENTQRTQPQPQQPLNNYDRPQSAAADDWARYASDFGSSENITRPFAREVEICYQRQRPRTIRAPRLSASTNDLSSNSQYFDNYNAYNVRRSHAPMLQPVAQQQRPHHASCYSVLERDPNPTYISTTTRRGVSPAPVSPAVQSTAQEPPYSPHAPERQRRASLPREIQEQQLKYISSKEEELRMEFDRLQHERRRLMEELNNPPATLQMPQHPMRDIYRPAPKLPTLTEDEVFRQQMAEEWLSKVAEREERRLQKIIKISKVNETQQGHQPHEPPHPKTDISDEFLKRVQERRTKLAMPPDSDWESGAESQPVAPGHASESDAEVPPVKVIEGKSETDLRQLPRHLREFARFSNHNEEKIDGGHKVVHQEEERRQEANANSMSSALKKSSVVKTVKIARQPEIMGQPSQRLPASVQQQQQQQQQGHSGTTSGGEQAITRHSHTSISTSTSTNRSSYETRAKLQHRSTTGDDGVVGVGGYGGSVDGQQCAASTAKINADHHQHSHSQHHHNQHNHHHHHHHHHHPYSHAHTHQASNSYSNSRPPAPHMRTCKKTRFLLEPNRRSWSESDLLKEIDSELKLAKGFLYANVFKVKHEYMSEPETEHDRPRKMAQLGRRQVDGIGPVTNDGMPIILRSEVKEPHQHEWYKRLYQTIHKQKSGDDYVIRYKCQRARPQLKSTGYQSEPEPNHDSDYSTVKYRTLDRRRLQSVSSATNVANRTTNSYQDDKVYGTMPNPIKSAPSTYKNQPGRIEDYVTGRSSVSEKERKEWWDEVMDIFNGHLDQAKLSPHYTEGNLSRALAKESGYTSDSNLVFRKREVPQASPLSPVEQKQAYKSVQAGGEPPLFGFRKPAPERPKDDGNDPPVPPKPREYRTESPNRYLESDVNIHFKTPIRHEYKQAMSDEELAQRQAEQMQKLYQEERRRKYLQELQDMNARRHTDNFTPSQKSPIPLNRYDDFQSDLAPKSPNTITTRTAARALYNFQGQNARELSFKKGDVIYIRRQIDRNWYEGEHNAMIGLLPVSYVEIVSKEATRQQPKKPSEGQARAKYNFQAQSGIELSLNKGELVTLTRRVDENWFEGKIANRKGIFPVSYVEVLTDIGAEDIAARTVISEHASVTNLRPSLDTLRTNINNEFNLITKNGHQPPNGILKETKHHNNKIDALHVDTHSEPLVYRALYKYRPQNSDEMELLEGDIVHVLEICDDGWFVGTSQRTGCFGTFPGNYVERLL